MKSFKSCKNCQKSTKRTITFGIFPTDSYKWCSVKCLFIWILKHNVKIDDYIVSEIIDRKGRKTFMNDLITMDDLTN